VAIGWDTLHLIQAILYRESERSSGPDASRTFPAMSLLFGVWNEAGIP
jgi:hypothetical protein